MKKQYDLAITSHGVTAMKTGFFEETAGLSMNNFDPARYIIHKAPKAIYRIDKLDVDSPEIQGFLKKVDAM